MAELYIPPLTYSPYKDHRDPRSPEEIQRALLTSTTLYIGNLSFYTTEEQIYEAFSKCGELKRIIMGLDRIKKARIPFFRVPSCRKFLCFFFFLIYFI
jgi:nuclear cap-binding protein subunit 2